MAPTLVEDLRAVQQREASILALQRDRDLKERRQSRRQRAKQRSASLTPPENAWTAITLAEVEGVAFRPGSLRQQLADGGLTPLGRWHLVLRLVEQGERAAHREESVPTDATEAGTDPVQHDSALSLLLATLSRDKLCYDIEYALGARVQDVLGSIQDDGDKIAGISEVLCFSSLVGGIACRVTCLRRGEMYSFRSSSYIPRLEAGLQNLIARHEGADGGMADALQLIRSGLASEQTR